MEYHKIIEFIRDLYKTKQGVIPLHAPIFKGNERKYLEECLESTFVSSVGRFVTQFENEIAKYTGSKKAIACINGTNALFLSLKLIGIEPETEVISQPMTFVATINAIRYCGANPVFIDIDRDTLGLSPEALKKWLRKNTEFVSHSANPINIKTGKKIAACIPMHTFGLPARIDEIVEICGEFNIPVVEDAAESLGSKYKNKHTGTFGDIGVLSFNGNKIITSGGGGMLLFQDENLAARAKHLTTQAKIPHPWEFLHDEIGYNFRMPNINAALGLAQLEKLDVFLENKRKIAEAYIKFFNGNAIRFFKETVFARSNYWLNTIIFKTRNERDLFLKYSNENGVMTRPAWQLMNRLPMFENFPSGDLTNAEWFADRIVNIPSSAIDL